MIRQLAHTCFFTDNLKRMVDFYTKSLGLKVKFTLDNKEGVPFGYYIECGHSTFIEIFDQALALKEWGGEKKPLIADSKYRHLCFEVTGLAEFRKVLEERGEKPTPIKTGMDGSLQSWTGDPDGNPIELMEYTARSRQLS